MYTCASVRIIFSFSASPYNVVVMGNNLYNRGEQLQLNCSSEGGPILEYTWLLSGSISPIAYVSTLVINNVSTTNGGDYTCNVTNNAGTENDTITVYSESLLCTYVYVFICLNMCVYM